MSEPEPDELRESLLSWVGRSLGHNGPAQAPDPVNVPMIRHWVDAMDDHNPIYLDEEAAAKTRHGGLVAPPAMLQTWLLPRPKIDGIGERRGMPTEDEGDNPIRALDRAGYIGSLMTNSELELRRYLRPGDRLSSETVVESISERKKTGVGQGYFLTWVTTYFDQHGEEVGTQLSRMFKFDPSEVAAAARQPG